MKKMMICLSLFCVCIFCNACFGRKYYRFLKPTEEIVEISIVAVSLSWEDKKVIETEITKVDNIDQFLDDFDDIECSAMSPPVGMLENFEDDIVIKILYQDNSYEFINHCGQSRYTEEKGLKYDVGISAFNEEQFEALITKYLSPAA